jgi:FKBP-type peptidyl-prolyl cis-trans isomerase
LRSEIVNEDGSVEIIVVEEGNGNIIEETDTVYYRHEHRFDNGQLVDLNETRKVADKLVMND